MSTTIQCYLQPSIPETQQVRSDGKDLADAFVSASIGGIDLAALMDDPTMELPVDVGRGEAAPSVFDPLSPYIDKESGFLGRAPTVVFPAAEGLAAIEQVLSALAGSDGERSVPSAELRRGAIHALEEYRRLLQAAHQQGASFAFYLEQ